MTSKEQAEEIIDRLRSKGYADDEIAEAVVNFLKELNSK
jgi:SOS response regulatory protein OraA/RecX